MQVGPQTESTILIRTVKFAYTIAAAKVREHSLSQNIHAVREGYILDAWPSSVEMDQLNVQIAVDDANLESPLGSYVRITSSTSKP